MVVNRPERKPKNELKLPIVLAARRCFQKRSSDPLPYYYPPASLPKKAFSWPVVFDAPALAPKNEPLLPLTLFSPAWDPKNELLKDMLVAPANAPKTSCPRSSCWPDRRQPRRMN